MGDTNKLVALLHELHRSPELSGMEKDTSARLASWLRACEPSGLVERLGGYGIVATFDSGLPGPALLFRAELDALPIAELEDVPHVSRNPGVSHKCGHDGHMSILAGLAMKLGKRPPGRGKVHLLFQPAEETGAGARAVLEDPRFREFVPAMGFALHNLPGVPKHAIVVRNGTFTASVGSLIVRFHGRTAHASEPELGLNPSRAIAGFLRRCDELNRTDPAREDFRLVTPVHVLIGSPAYGVSAGEGEVHLTLRCWKDADLDAVYELVLGEAEVICHRHELSLTHESLQRFYAIFNDPSTTDMVRRAAHGCGLRVIEQASPVKAGEDFGLFSARFPCCLFGVGAGEETPPLHSTDYDFPDDLIGTGVDILGTVVRGALG
jgi:amidohydrolase